MLHLRTSALLAPLVLGLFTGCVRPATEADCEEIVERAARLKLKETAALRPETENAEVERLKQKLREKTLESCVGKRISSRALECVRSAETSDAVSRCFR